MTYVLYPTFRIILAALTFCMIMAATHATTAWADGEFYYSAMISDLPIPTGIDELADQGYILDKPEGRIVSTTLFCPPAEKIDQVISFYNETLPQMGWIRSRDGLYIREQEHLRIKVTKTPDSGHLIDFVITPN